MIVLSLSLSGMSVAFAEPRRVAVVVGSNAAMPGSGALRYAQADAELVASTLVEVGRVEPEHVHLLRDPTPAEILEELRSAVIPDADGSLLFYYSGHADASSLYPGGRPLPLEDVREAMEASGARLRIGIVDACQGGSWTGAKGWTTDPVPFSLPDVVDSEGSAWIASTSGSEEAHEAEIVAGSLFTHHLVMGLRGAADESAEGQVTLSEVFAYAKRHTARDAAVYAEASQTPSFHLELRGKSDVVLSTVDAASSEVRVVQREGPLQVLHVDSGVVLLELEPGQREVRLALAPGSYVVRRVTGAGVLSTSVELEADQTVTIDEAGLELHGRGRLATKGRDLRWAPTESIVPAGHVDLRPGLWLVDTPRPVFRAAWSPSEWLQVALPGSVAGRFRVGERHELVPWAGLTDLGWEAGFRYTQWGGRLGGGAAWRWHLSPRASLQIGATFTVGWTTFSGTGWVDDLDTRGLHGGAVRVTLIWSQSIGRWVTMNVPLQLNEGGKLFLLDEAWRAGRPLPVVQIHVANHVTVDLSRRTFLFDLNNQRFFFPRQVVRGTVLGATITL